MDSIKDGGAAFPIAWMQYTQQGYIVPQGKNEGMSLRDYFAGQALVGLINTIPHMIKTPEFNEDLLTKSAYIYADSMLKAREAKP